MSAPAYLSLAAELRRAVLDGTYLPGTTLPRIVDLATERGIAKQTVREAVALLESEGLVDVVRRRGTVVRERTTPKRLVRTRRVYRDDIGYYFDPTAQGWRALETPTVGWAPAPPDIAAGLGVRPGEDVLVRDRIIGEPETRTPMQIATSYLPAAIARGTRLAEPDTGPGGIYDRLEQDLGHRPLAWEETIGSRMPTPTETRRLGLRPGTPLLRITRTTTGPDGTVVEINDTRMSADLFSVGYAVERHPEAR
ncbi:GntR family transcriptional regulator [Embleya sp. NPDC005971]|uniref:GntR family transcriptional regulator n=1 Tax=Embleya sp. NPDC005971 TaxID=3156724 RepID=UPI0033D93FDA